jgi:hypothetical protein
MDNIINYAVITLVVLVVAILAVLGIQGLRQPVLAKIGLRNIPRRPAQSILIVIGLTLSTIRRWLPMARWTRSWHHRCSRS